jgi:peptide/nickel transport system ATP-binding protein
VLRVKGLSVGFDTQAGFLQAVDGVSFDVHAHRTLGIVGESGCGKSVTAATVLRLIPRPPGRILGGEVWLGDQDILVLPSDQLAEIRGNEISMIFQDPMTSLNPVFTIEKQLFEVLSMRFGMGRDEARGRAVEMLRTVGIAEPESRLRAYPHELSGGMKQRVMIAMALLCEPRVLIADEPTTALDVTIQAQILHLIKDLQERTGTAVILITHDMGVVAETCDEVAVMYAGASWKWVISSRSSRRAGIPTHAACSPASRRGERVISGSCRPSRAWSRARPRPSTDADSRSGAGSDVRCPRPMPHGASRATRCSTPRARGASRVTSRSSGASGCPGWGRERAGSGRGAAAHGRRAREALPGAGRCSG